jgi:hypothetical protein
VSWLSKVFTLNPSGPAWPRAVLFLDAAIVPLVVFSAIGYEQHLLSALFGLLFAALADPGAATGRARRASAPLRRSAQRSPRWALASPR